MSIYFRYLILFSLTLSQWAYAQPTEKLCRLFQQIEQANKNSDVDKILGAPLNDKVNKGKAYRWISTDGAVYHLTFFLDGKVARMSDIDGVNLFPNEEEFINLGKNHLLTYTKAEELMGPGKLVGYLYTYTFSEDKFFFIETNLNGMIVDRNNNFC